MIARARELDSPPASGFDRVGEVEMALSRFGAGDIHGSVDEVARRAAEIGGDSFYVTESLGPRITAVVYRRRPKRRWFGRRV
ncbi:DUF1471 domain-containing protein [Nocardia nova]|uniref:DUF1471 domain-containing protein n=1 Tax=Nocardia nova TaxID=37330 RepID=UPI00046D5813|nr:DUF1471 domain-containing protein [Nocardia nova]